MTNRITLLVTLVLGTSLCLIARADERPHNVILFVPDGLRSQMVRADTAPAMASMRDEGVTFNNSHSLYPTLTTANASAMATGHYLGDTGDFSNAIYVGFAVSSAGGSVTPFLENDQVLSEMDEHFGGDYLNADTLLKAARDSGFNTAAIGKIGPVLIFDHTENSGQKTIISDDATGSPGGIVLPQWVVSGLTDAGLPVVAPSRVDNGQPGSATKSGTLTPNIVQQQWFVDLIDKVVLPKFKQDGKPFVLIFWSRDPDGTQHNQGDSLNQFVPGINGPTSLAAIKNVDNDLRQIREALAALQLDQTTDIVISADHGFSTISKQSASSAAAKIHYSDVPDGFLPPGFLAKDLSSALNLALWDPDHENARVATDAHSVSANGVLGADPKNPAVVIAGSGGSDLIYLPARTTMSEKRNLAGKIIKTLFAQDYVSGVFVDSRLGKFRGTLALDLINLKGSAITPIPAIIVNFKSFSTGCALPYTCAVEVADNPLQQGQGMHGSFSRADTFNFTAAYGPDFKRRFVDSAPVSNADVGMTIAAVLQLTLSCRGKLSGRVLSEAMPNGKIPRVIKARIVSRSAENGLRTILNYQLVGRIHYFDAAGFHGRTVGLDGDMAVH
jgi:hypothetical protein